MKITPFIFCGFLLAVTTSCNSSDNTGKSSATSEPSHTVGTTSTENNPTSDETKIDVPAEPVENSAEEKSESAPVEETKLTEEAKTETPVKSSENQPVEEKSTPTPVELQANTPPVQTTNDNKTEDNQAIAAGKKLHDEQCVTCHANKVKGDPTTLYTREDRKVKDLNGLQGQVERCVTVLNVEWFDSEIDSVVQYLNADFYKFTPKSNQ